MNAYLQLTLAQLRIFARNRSVIFFSLLFPILLMLALGTFVGGGGGVTLNGAIVDEDRSDASAAWIRALEAQQLVQSDTAGSREQALKALEEGDVQLAIVLPSGYGAALQAAEQSGAAGGTPAAGAGATIQVYYDETNLNVSQLGLTAIEQVSDTLSKQLSGYQALIGIEAQGIQSVNLSYIDFLVPGIVAMMIMSNNLNGVSGQIAAWRERGILRRMQSTTLKARTFIAAQITARLLLNGVQAMLVLLIGSLVFGTQMNGSWLLLVLFVVLGTLAFMSIGFIIAGLAKNPETAGPIAGFISFPLLFLGNVFFPIRNMPDLVQPLVQAIPITHLATGLRQVMNVGAGVADIWPQLLILGAWMVVAFAIASRTFKWE